MEGMVTGPLSVSPNTDPVFRGLLRRATDIDYCLLKGPDGQEKWCIASLDGEAWMNVELTVYAEAGRGAWLKATPEPGTLKRLNVSGDCESADVAEIRQDYPSGSSGGSPSGQPIAEGGGPLGSMFRNSAGTRGLAVPGTYLRNQPETIWSILVTSIVPP